LGTTPPTPVTDARSAKPGPEPALETGPSAARLAHEFNNLLTGILGHVAMLGNDPSLSPAVRQELGQIRRAADRAAELTAQVRALGSPGPAAPRLSGPLPIWDPADVGGDETILLVEDEDDVRELARRVLEQQGYTILDAPDAESAVALANRHPGHIHLLLTDVLLPRLGGRELAARLSIHRPATKVLYISGSSDGVITRHRMLEPGTEFLEKPFSLDHLLRAVRHVLGPPEAARPV
jgi:CheY-like chemotaxis protein